MSASVISGVDMEHEEHWPSGSWISSLVWGLERAETFFLGNSWSAASRLTCNPPCQHQPLLLHSQDGNNTFILTFFKTLTFQLEARCAQVEDRNEAFVPSHECYKSFTHTECATGKINRNSASQPTSWDNKYKPVWINTNTHTTVYTYSNVLTHASPHISLWNMLRNVYGKHV